MNKSTKKSWGALLGFIFAIATTSGFLMKAEEEQLLQGEPKISAEELAEVAAIKEAKEATGEEAPATAEDIANDMAASTDEIEKEEDPVLNEDIPAPEETASEIDSDVDAEDISSDLKEPHLIIRFLASMKQNVGVLGQGMFKCLDWRDEFYGYTKHNRIVTNFYKLLDWAYQKLYGKPLHVKSSLDLLRDTVFGAINTVKRGGENLDLKGEIEKVCKGAYGDEDIASLQELLDGVEEKPSRKILKDIIKLAKSYQRQDKLTQEREKLAAAIESNIKSVDGATSCMLALLNKAYSGKCSEADLDELKKMFDEAPTRQHRKALEGLMVYVSTNLEQQKNMETINDADEKIKGAYLKLKEQEELTIKEMNERVSSFVDLEHDNGLDTRSLNELAEVKEQTIRTIKKYKKVKEEKEQELDPSLKDALAA